MAFRDDLDGAVGHFDGAFIVNRIRRVPKTGRPSFRVGHGIFRQHLVIQVRKDREVHHAQRAVAPSERLPPDEVLPDPGGHHHAPSAQPHPDRLM